MLQTEDPQTPVQQPPEPFVESIYGRSGGEETLKRHGREHFSEAGKKSAEVRSQKYGKEHYRELGKKSVIKRRENKLKKLAKRKATIKENKSPTGILSRFLLGKLK